QQIEHVRFGGGIDNRQMLAVVANIQHRNFERGGMPHRGLAGFEINLHTVLPCKFTQPPAESIDLITLCGETNTPAQADPVQALKNMPVALLDLSQQLIETVEVVVLAVVVNHHALNAIDTRHDALHSTFAHPAEPAGRVGQLAARNAHARV